MFKTLVRRAAFPVRRYFNPRFESVVLQAERAATAAQSTHHVVVDLADSAADLGAVTGRALEQLRTTVQELDTLVRARLSPGGVTSLDGLTPEMARLFTREQSHLGLAAAAGLWLNPAVSVSYQPHEVKVGGVNERIAEVPFAFGAVSTLPQGARILDVGSAESTLALSIAALGYRVTATDPRGYPFEHPNLTSAAVPVDELTDDEPFDAVVCLSTVEHIGIGAYGLPTDEDGDIRAMRAVTQLVRPGGMLVFTSPFGRYQTTELERVYDDERLGSLLEGWDVQHRSYLRHGADGVWMRDADGVGETRGVVLVTATRQP